MKNNDSHNYKKRKAASLGNVLLNERLLALGRHRVMGAVEKKPGSPSSWQRSYVLFRKCLFNKCNCFPLGNNFNSLELFNS